MNIRNMTRTGLLCATAAAGPAFADPELNIHYVPLSTDILLLPPSEPAAPQPAPPTPSWICDGIEQNSLTGDLFVLQRPEENIFVMQPRIMGLDGTTWAIEADLSDPEPTPMLQAVWTDGSFFEMSPQSEEFAEQGYSILFGLTDEHGTPGSLTNISFEEYENGENVCYLEVFDGEMQVGCKLTSGHFSSFTITKEFTTLAGTYFVPVENETNPYQVCIYQIETPAAGQSLRFVLP